MYADWEDVAGNDTRWRYVFWEHERVERGGHILRTTDSYLTIVGESSTRADSSASERDIVITFLDADGAVVDSWRTGTTHDDVVQTVKALPGGGFLIGGSTAGTMAGVPGALGGEDGFVLEFDTAGFLRTPLQLGTPEDDRVTAIDVDGKGRKYVVGGTEGDLFDVQKGDGDAFIFMMDDTESLLYTLQWGTGSYDRALAVRKIGDGIIVAGETAGAMEKSNGGVDIFLMKIGADATVIWTRQWGTDADERLHAMTLGSDGSIYLAGEATGAISEEYDRGKADTFLVRFDSKGDFEWVRQSGSPGDDAITALLPQSDGVTAIGTLYGGDRQGNDVFLVTVDADGNVSMPLLYDAGGDEMPVSLLPGDSGGYLIGGYRESHSGAAADIFVLRVK